MQGGKPRRMTSMEKRASFKTNEFSRQDPDQPENRQHYQRGLEDIILQSCEDEFPLIPQEVPEENKSRRPDQSARVRKCRKNRDLQARCPGYVGGKVADTWNEVTDRQRPPPPAEKPPAHQFQFFRRNKHIPPVFMDQE